MAAPSSAQGRPCEKINPKWPQGREIANAQIPPKLMAKSLCQRLPWIDD